MKPLKILSVFGTRPEAIKMAPLVKELSNHPEFESRVCVTAQHREQLDQVLEIFKIHPEYDLNLMLPRQTLKDITVRALDGLDGVLNDFMPDLVLVHGDTTTTFVGSLAAFYHMIDVGHVEAGLRTYDKYSPYPEEMNRSLTGRIAKLHFSPTTVNRDNLIRENIKTGVYITGNTVIDALKYTVQKDYAFSNPTYQTLDPSKRILLVEAHRRENLGEPMRNICFALKDLVENNPDTVLVWPVHLNPAVRETVFPILDGHDRILLTEPADPADMHNLMGRSHLILTDSGGLQEEAPSLGKPVIVLRRETERGEALQYGTVKLAGTDKDVIVNMAQTLLSDEKAYNRMAKAVNPYGDGNASRRICEAILFEYGFSKKKPDEFLV